MEIVKFVLIVVGFSAGFFVLLWCSSNTSSVTAKNPRRSRHYRDCGGYGHDSSYGACDSSGCGGGDGGGD